MLVKIWEVLSLSTQEAWRNTNSTNQGGMNLQTSIVDCCVAAVEVQGTVPAKVVAVTQRNDLFAAASLRVFLFHLQRLLYFLAFCPSAM
jgi:hypothetical protein